MSASCRRTAFKYVMPAAALLRTGHWQGHAAKRHGGSFRLALSGQAGQSFVIGKARFRFSGPNRIVNDETGAFSQWLHSPAAKLKWHIMQPMRES
jgi:hypothetical protein